MAFRLVVLCAMLALARAGNIVTPVQPAVAVPVAKAAVVADTEFDPHPQYNYAYDIQDAITGDNKGHQEIRDGDVVQGRYFLIDADGTRRTVEYTADPVNGFNAVVHREPLVAAAPVVKTVAPVVQAAPAVVAARVATPFAYTAKVATPITYTAQVATPFAYQARYATPIGAPVAYAQPATFTKTIVH